MSKVRCVFSRRICSLSISDRIFVVTYFPSRCFKEISPQEVHNVEELKTLYVPSFSKGTGPGSLVYKSTERVEENYDGLFKFIGYEEVMPARMPRYCPRNI